MTGNSDCGIAVREASSARIGLNFDGATPFASPNTITGNATGICLNRGGVARIAGNTISNNTGSGVFVTRNSQADISANTISGNGLDGIQVNQNSSVRLGQDTGSGITYDPNSGTNTRYGINCSMLSSADGRLGTLSGTEATKHFDTSSANSLLP